MNRQLLLSFGLLATSILVVVPGCGDDDASGDTDNKAGESSSAGQSSAGQSNAGQSAGGSGSVVLPQGGEGGVAQTQGGNGGIASVEGGASPGGAGAGGVAGGAGGEGGSANSCIVSASYGNLIILDGEVTFTEAGAFWQGEVVAAEPYQAALSIELYDGISPFTNGVTTVTNHVLAGDDLNYQTCGLCVRLVDRQEGDLDHAHDYLVTGGTITLTSVEGHVSGHASNLTFEEVTIDPEYLSTPVPNGCQSSISAIAFDGTEAQGGAGGAGG